MRDFRQGSRRLPAYGSLLAIAFLLLMLSPLLTASDAGLKVERVLGGVVLVAALLAAGVGRRVLAVLVPVLIAAVVVGSIGSHRLEDVAIGVRLVLLVYVELCIVTQVLREEHVGWDTVAGTAAGYVVLAVIWGDAFFLLERAQPGSFAIDPGFLTGASHDLRPALAYFSFVTLTTVGYGEIHPTTTGAGGVCVAEAMIGQLYLAIMISRMVGLHLSRNTTSAASER